MFFMDEARNIYNAACAQIAAALAQEGFEYDLASILSRAGMTISREITFQSSSEILLFQNREPCPSANFSLV
jgi:hypothetical protein